MNKYTVVLSSRYKKSFKRFSRHKDFDLNILEEVVRLLSCGEILPTKFKDHKLSGEMKDLRECHVRGDLLLVYQKHDDILILLLVDLGSHSSLFK